MTHPQVVGQNGFLRWQSLTLDADQGSVQVGPRVVPASPAEFGLLHLLLSRRNLPMSKDFIMTELFGDDHRRDPRQVDMFVARLRRSLSAVGLAGLIATVEGRGYAVLDQEGDTLSESHAQPHGWEALAVAC